MKRWTTVASALAVSMAVVACSGGDDSTTAQPAAATDGGLRVVAGDMYFEPETLTADAGSITFELVNEGSAVHNIVIEEAGDTNVVETSGGVTDTGSIDLDAGTYTFYCDIPGHRSAMEGTLTVR